MELISGAQLTCWAGDLASAPRLPSAQKGDPNLVPRFRGCVEDDMIPPEKQLATGPGAEPTGNPAGIAVVDGAATIAFGHMGGRGATGTRCFAPLLGLSPSAFMFPVTLEKDKGRPGESQTDGEDRALSLGSPSGVTKMSWTWTATAAQHCE